MAAVDLLPWLSRTAASSSAWKPWKSAMAIKNREKEKIKKSWKRETNDRYHSPLSLFFHCFCFEILVK
jgi:hypothetical protein